MIFLAPGYLFYIRVFGGRSVFGSLWFGSFFGSFFGRVCKWGSSFFLLLLLGRVRALSGVFMLSLYSGWEAFFFVCDVHTVSSSISSLIRTLIGAGNNIQKRFSFLFLFFFFFLVLSLFFSLLRHFLLLGRKKNLWLEIVGQNLG